jgi:hypothetical protein
VLLNAGDGTFPTNIELPGGSAYTSGGSAHVHKVDCGGLDGDGDLGGLLGNISRDSRVLLNAGEAPSFLNCY